MRANYKVELTSGIFLLMGIAALLWLATSATDYGMKLSDDSYRLTARFTDVGELKPRAPVKIGGVTVGLVGDISLDPVSFDAVVGLDIDQRFNDLPSDTIAAIVTAGILGDRYIDLTPGGALDALADGDQIIITQSAILLENLISQFLFNTGKDNSQ